VTDALSSARSLKATLLGCGTGNRHAHALTAVSATLRGVPSLAMPMPVLALSDGCGIAHTGLPSRVLKKGVSRFNEASGCAFRD
jgi:hypothetical protein